MLGGSSSSSDTSRLVAKPFTCGHLGFAVRLVGVESSFIKEVKGLGLGFGIIVGSALRFGVQRL